MPPKSQLQPSRPLYITITGWALLAFSAVGVILAVYLFLTTNFGRDNTIAVVIVFAASNLLQVAMAVGILKGANWARVLFLCLTPADIIVSVASLGVTEGLVFKTCYFVVFAVFLTRPHASAFFFPSKGRHLAAYAFAIVWIALTVFVTFLPEIVNWAEKTYRIGYIRHDTASLKLPPDWKRADADQPLPGTWYQIASGLGLDRMAWAGQSPVPRPQLDFETGRVVSDDNAEAFKFEPGYVRDDGSVMPCGLARYRLAFPNGTADPLRLVLTSQLNLHGTTLRHQYIWNEVWRILEIDVAIGDARFVVWNWWRADEPSHVIGMILGMRGKDFEQRDSCGISEIISSLELSRPDGSVWQASELNAQANPAMTPVSALLIEIDFDRFRAFDINGAAFFSWLEKHLNDANLEHSHETVSSLIYQQADTPPITLADIARITRIGMGIPQSTDPLHLMVVDLLTECRPAADALQTIREIYSSTSNLKVSLKPLC